MRDVDGDITDGQAVTRTLSGDGQAFSLLVTRYQRQIFDLMLRMTGSPENAADLAQDTFVKAYERLGSLASPDRFFSWLYALGMNLGRDSLRRRGRDPLLYDQDAVERWASLAPGPETEAVAQSEIELLASGLSRLDSDSRELLILRYRDGVPFAELADIVGLSEGAAKMRVRRGLDRLREFMEERDDA